MDRPWKLMTYAERQQRRRFGSARPHLEPQPMTPDEIRDLLARARNGTTPGQVENGLKTRARHDRMRARKAGAL